MQGYAHDQPFHPLAKKYNLLVLMTLQGTRTRVLLLQHLIIIYVLSLIKSNGRDFDKVYDSLFLPLRQKISSDFFETWKKLIHNVKNFNMKFLQSKFEFDPMRPAPQNGVRSFLHAVPRAEALG